MSTLELSSKLQMQEDREMTADAKTYNLQQI